MEKKIHFSVKLKRKTGRSLYFYHKVWINKICLCNLFQHFSVCENNTPDIVLHQWKKFMCYPRLVFSSNLHFACYCKHGWQWLQILRHQCYAVQWLESANLHPMNPRWNGHLSMLENNCFACKTLLGDSEIGETVLWKWCRWIDHNLQK